jgi:putative heme iron utilization protein
MAEKEKVPDSVIAEADSETKEASSATAEKSDPVLQAVGKAFAPKQGYVIHIAPSGDVYIATGDHAQVLLNPRYRRFMSCCEHTSSCCKHTSCCCSC